MYLFIDTETTGLPTRRNAHYTEPDVWPHVVSISWAILRSQHDQLQQAYWIIRPEGFVIPEEATRIHGISTDFALANGRPLREVLGEIQAAIDNHHPEIVVAHNLAFDLPVLLCELHRLGLNTKVLEMNSCCTMKASTNYCAIPHADGNGCKWPRLSKLYAKLFGTEFDGQHNASQDVLACARCYFRLRDLGIIGPNSSVSCQCGLGQDQASGEAPVEIERLLRIIPEFAGAHPEFDLTFVYSLRKQFRARGALTMRQVAALRNIVAGWHMEPPSEGLAQAAENPI